MTMFAAIHVHQDYDNIEGIECLKVFSVETECNNFIQKMKLIEKNEILSIQKYIEEFVDKIVLPTENNEWEKTVEKYYGKHAFYTHNNKLNFKKRLIESINLGYISKLDNYNPPKKTVNNSNNIFKLEIK